MQKEYLVSATVKANYLAAGMNITAVLLSSNFPTKIECEKLIHAAAKEVLTGALKGIEINAVSVMPKGWSKGIVYTQPNDVESDLEIINK